MLFVKGKPTNSRVDLKIQEINKESTIINSYNEEEYRCIEQVQRSQYGNGWHLKIETGFKEQVNRETIVLIVKYKQGLRKV